MNQLAQQIRVLRTANNLSQDELAEKLYISRQAVSKWENGEATPDIDKLVQLAEIFGVSLDYLVLEKNLRRKLWWNNEENECLGILERRIQTTSYKRRFCLSHSFSLSSYVQCLLSIILTKLAKQQAFSTFLL